MGTGGGSTAGGSTGGGEEITSGEEDLEFDPDEAITETAFETVSAVAVDVLEVKAFEESKEPWNYNDLLDPADLPAVKRVDGDSLDGNQTDPPDQRVDPDAPQGDDRGWRYPLLAGLAAGIVAPIMYLLIKKLPRWRK